MWSAGFRPRLSFRFQMINARAAAVARTGELRINIERRIVISDGVVELSQFQISKTTVV